jgi:hypothetical protein
MRCLTLLLTVFLLAGSATAKDDVFSGPQPGEELVPLKVRQVSPPDVVKDLEIVSAADDFTMLIFLHKLTEQGVGLMMHLEWYAHHQEELASHYVFLTDDRAKGEQILKRWVSRPLFADSPMCISLDGPEGPGRYGLNRNVAMTVLIAKENKVVVNLVLTQPNLTDAPKILGSLATMLDKPKPSSDKIRSEMRIARQKRRKGKMRDHPVFKLAPNAQLGELMLSMLYGERVNEEHVANVERQMTKWVGDKAERKAALTKYAKAVLGGKFEINRYAREVLEKLVKTE